MAVVEVHVSVYAPEGDQAICQSKIRDRVPTVPPVIDALREVDWALVKENVEGLCDEVKLRVMGQVDDYQAYIEARSSLPSDDTHAEGNGNS